MARATPYAGFRFVLHVGAGRALGGFAEVSGLESSADPRSMPVPIKVWNVTLMRGVANSEALREWLGDGRARASHDVSIAMRDERGALLRTWKLRRSLPLKYTGPGLAAQGGDVAVEELVLSAEGLDLGD
jgi:phage tail-like protein